MTFKDVYYSSFHIFKFCMLSENERKKFNAEQYLAQQKVHSLFERLTFELTLSRPTNPFQFMTDRITKIQADPVSKYYPYKLNVLVGGPNSGKTHLSLQMRKDIGVVRISPSDLKTSLKENCTNQTVSHLLAHLSEILHTADAQRNIDNEGHSLVLFDDFPLNIVQALQLESVISPLFRVIYLDASVISMRSRINKESENWAESKSFEDKMNHFIVHTLPLIDYYKSLKKLCVIDANRSIMEVATELIHILKN